MVKPQPAIFYAKTMHRRFFPKVNAFTYRLYYLAFPYAARNKLADGWRFGVNRAGLMSYHDKDRLAPETIIRDWQIPTHPDSVILITMPRVLGYGFNPVSFWLCLNASGQLCAVIAEVNNTFGETHSYLCRHLDYRPIQPEDTLRAEKIFHVSPFMTREGYYQFRFRYVAEEGQLGIWIDYHHEDGRLHLATWLIGRLIPYNAANRRRMFWQIPLLSLRVITLIHWQALKLWLKGIKYIPKPLQRAERFSTTRSE